MCMSLPRHPCSYRVDPNFGSRLHTNPKLGWPQGVAGLLLHRLHQAFRRQPPQDFSDCYGADAAVGLGTATRPAPASVEAIAGQAWPCAIRFTRRAKCTTTVCAVPGGPASRRCWMRRPDGPGAVSAGKLRKARATASSDMSSARGKHERSAAGGGWAGWSARSAAMVSAVSGQRPFCMRALQAFRSKPSRAKSKANSRFWSSFKSFLCPRPGCGISSQRLRRSPSDQRRKRSTV